MSLNRALIVTLIGCAVSASIGLTGPAQSQHTIQINETKETYEVSVPVSQLTMTIPKAGLRRDGKPKGGSADSHNYFYFEDRNLTLIVSGWFEPEGTFSGIEQLWQGETEASRRSGLPAPQHVTFQKVERWESIIYDIPFGTGSNSHIRGEWIEAGT